MQIRKKSKLDQPGLTDNREAPCARSNSASLPSPGHGIADDKHRRMVAEAAFFRAKKRNFCGGDPVQDWFAAEAEIRMILGQKR